MSVKVRETVLPLLAALIWGTAFVAQKVNTAGTFFFNASRSFVAFLFLIVLTAFVTRFDLRHLLWEEDRKKTGALWTGGAVCGFVLFAATFCQQYGMDTGTEAGKCSFITALYLVLVPILGIFLKKKAGLRVWVSIAIAIAGMYLLCIREGFTIRRSDVFVLMSAVFYAFQIVSNAIFTEKAHALKLSCLQFFFCGLFSALISVFAEQSTMADFTGNLLPILYLGIMSSGVAYTLEIVSLKGTNMTIVTLLFSLESVFGVLSSAILLRERLTGREYLGCAFVLLAVLLCQVGIPRFAKKKKKRASS